MEPAARPLVERFDRRGTEPFELFRSEFGQNSGTSAKKFKFRSARTEMFRRAVDDSLYHSMAVSGFLKRGEDQRLMKSEKMKENASEITFSRTTTTS